MDVLKLSIYPIRYILESRMEMIDEPYEIDSQMDEYVAQRDGGYSWKKHKALAAGIMRGAANLVSLYYANGGQINHLQEASMNREIIHHLANELKKIGVPFDKDALEDFIRTL